jgi:hypothetical protein
MLRLFISLFAFALFTQTSIVYAKVSNEAEAVKNLLSKINKTQVYGRWLKPGCSKIVIESKSTDFYDMVVYEKHSGNCEGDPNTSPVIDRFRVSRKTNSVLWYDITNAQYLPFRSLIEYRNSGKWLKS